jgi:hypothetical protein
MAQLNPVNPKGVARTLGVAVLAFVALPVFALMTFGMRFLLPAVVVAGVFAAVFSPAFRRWFV